jgi:hypothetical protein
MLIGLLGGARLKAAAHTEQGARSLAALRRNMRLSSSGTDA